MTEQPVFLTIEQVADLLQVSPSALYVQRHRSQAPGCLAVRVGRRLRWRRADIDAWFDAQLEQAAAVPR